MALLDCAITEKCCRVDGGRGICPLFSSPPRGIWQLKSSPPREFAIAVYLATKQLKYSQGTQPTSQQAHGSDWQNNTTGVMWPLTRQGRTWTAQPSKAKKMLMPEVSPGEWGVGVAGRSWNWLMHNCCNRLLFSGSRQPIKYRNVHMICFQNSTWNPHNHKRDFFRNLLYD